MAKKPTKTEAGKPQLKFYHSLNCQHAIDLGARQVHFSPYSLLGGAWCGIFVSADEEICEALDKLVASGKSLVSGLTKAEFINCYRQKKSSTATHNDSMSADYMSLPKELRVELAGGVIPVETNPIMPSEPEPVKPLESVEDALTVEKIS